MHPMVKQFKQLMDNYPQLKNEMKQRQFSLQQFFEEWYVLGEEKFLDKYLKEGNDGVEDFSQKKETTSETTAEEKEEENNATDVSLFIDNAVAAVSTISGLLSMFRTNKSAPKSSTSKDMKSLFQFRED